MPSLLLRCPQKTVSGRPRAGGGCLETARPAAATLSPAEAGTGLPRLLQHSCSRRSCGAADRPAAAVPGAALAAAETTGQQLAAGAGPAAARRGAGKVDNQLCLTVTDAAPPASPAQPSPAQPSPAHSSLWPGLAGLAARCPCHLYTGHSSGHFTLLYYVNSCMVCVIVYCIV